MVLWLLLSAIQDRRTRHISNPWGAFGSWLAMPPFFPAWPAALLLDNLLLAFATFVGVHVAFRWSGDGFGPAGGKVAVGLAGIAPFALFAGVAVQVLVFAACRLRGEREARLPGALGYYAGVVIMALTSAGQWTIYG